MPSIQKTALKEWKPSFAPVNDSCPDEAVDTTAIAETACGPFATAWRRTLPRQGNALLKAMTTAQ